MINNQINLDNYNIQKSINNNGYDEFGDDFDSMSKNVEFFSTKTEEFALDFFCNFKELMKTVELNYNEENLMECKNLFINSLIGRLKKEIKKEGSTDLKMFLRYMSRYSESFKDITTDVFISIFDSFDKGYAKLMAKKLLKSLVFNEDSSKNFSKGSDLIFQFFDPKREKENEGIFENDALFKFISKTSVNPLKTLRNQATYQWNLRDNIGLESEMELVAKNDSVMTNILGVMKDNPKFFSVADEEVYLKFFEHLSKLIKFFEDKGEVGKNCKKTIKNCLKEIVDARLELSVQKRHSELTRFSKYLEQTTCPLFVSVQSYIEEKLSK